NFLSFSQCHTKEQNVPPARKSEPRGTTVVWDKFCSDKIKEICTRRVTNQAPSQASRNLREEAIPKSIARVLNASQIRSEWKQSLGKRKQWDGERGTKADSQCKSQKKAKRSDAGTASEDTKLPPIRIQPGESLAHFNKRVEESMRPLVKSAVQSSSAHMRKLAKDMSTKGDKKSQNPSDSSVLPSPTKVKHPWDGAKPDPDPAQGRDEGQKKKPSREFATTSTSTPKRVNDIVQAPPQIKHLPRNARKIVAASGKGKKSDAVVSMAQKVMMEAERENAIQRYRKLKERRLKQHQKNIDVDS
ncbi:hypothetical protein BDM02DRAFT_2583928, partial [Thelephora ganbajun]